MIVRSGPPAKFHAARDILRDDRGVLNVAGADVVSRYEFACLVAEAGGLRREHVRRSSIATAGLSRPRNCALSTERAASLLRTRLRGAREFLRDPRAPGQAERPDPSPPDRPAN